MIFSAAFSSRFAAEERYIGPMTAQAALVAGAAWQLAGDSLLIDWAVLIGPAGKVYSFRSPESAARWVENTKGVGGREAALMASIDPATAAAWKEKKRARLEVVAGRLVVAAGRQDDEKKRVALLAESDYCLNKWG